MAHVELKSRARSGSWQGRPAGIPSAVPPPSVPLSFLAASGLGLVACGIAWAWASSAAVVDPTADRVVAAAHFGMLATLSMGVLGALHQFAPVVSQRPLRSDLLARLTFVCWLAASWLLPLGIGTEREAVIESGGGLAAVAIALVVVNLSLPLSARGKGAPVMGLRLAVAGFAVTGCFGVLYVTDRRGSWFDLSGHVVLAHAVVGLFAWLGLTYVSVAEKLWPMFFLAHIPGKRRCAWVAVWGVAWGVALLSPGLLAGLPWLIAAGAAVLAVGLGAHSFSLIGHVRHRRRPPDLHLAFVLTAAVWMLAGAGFAVAAAVVMPSDHHLGVALVATSAAAFGGWLLSALIGHAHKVVPFIAWAALRARGIDKNDSGQPLMFAHLYDRGWARATYVLTTTGLVALCAGLAASSKTSIVIGGASLVAAGVIVSANLSVVPARMMSNLSVVPARKASSLGAGTTPPLARPPAGSPHGADS